MKVKICGINDALAFDTAVDAGAEWVSFVFFSPSPRYVAPERAAVLSPRHRDGPLRVGLFVDPTETDIADMIGTLRLDALQVYDAVDAASLRARFGLPIWRAVGVAGDSDLSVSADGADALLIWSLLRGWDPPGPWLLAGGLTPANVGSAIGFTGATAVDVSSGVERRRSEKDPELIRAFIATARAEAGRPLSQPENEGIQPAAKSRS